MACSLRFSEVLWFFVRDSAVCVPAYVGSMGREGGWFLDIFAILVVGT